MSHQRNQSAWLSPWQPLEPTPAGGRSARRSGPPRRRCHDYTGAGWAAGRGARKPRTAPPRPPALHCGSYRPAGCGANHPADAKRLTRRNRRCPRFPARPPRTAAVLAARGTLCAREDAPSGRTPPRAQNSHSLRGRTTLAG